jgi:hypothetical protein
MANYHDIRYNFAIPSDSGSGAKTLIKTLTASSSGTLSFVNGASDVVLDNTYRTYIFKFNNIHPETDNTHFQFQADTGTNTNYNQTMTTTWFYALNQESGATPELTYATGTDQAQGTGFQTLAGNVGNANDESCSGELWLFSPSSSVFVKHYLSRVSCYQKDNFSMDDFSAGYFNTTTALTRVQFKMSSDAIDAGTIKLYGIA